MDSKVIFHACVLNFHQPAWNLEDLLRHKPWEAREILFALDRVPRSVWGWEDVARVHLVLSGTLLEALTSPDFQSRVYGTVKCGDLLYHLRNPALDILATGYYHPVLPLIPKSDREEHILRWFGIARHLFARHHFSGFWPPEMGFSMDMIPLLRRLGFRYVLVDSEHVQPLSDMSWHELRYRPHLATYEDETIIIVVRDRELSNAQESGMEIDWFIDETRARTEHCKFPPLVTTCSDGDNGGWFRNVDMQANFWGVFYRPLLTQVRGGNAQIVPIHIDDYLNRYDAHGHVHVRTGAWNTGDHSGIDFLQWTGSSMQRQAMDRVRELSNKVHNLRWFEGERGFADAGTALQIEQCMWHLLRAETSCNFYWGEAWVHRCHQDLDQVQRIVEAVA